MHLLILFEILVSYEIFISMCCHSLDIDEISRRLHCTEVRFASFLSGGFTTMAVTKIDIKFLPLHGPGPNVSTTPITAIGCRQCLPIIEEQV